MKFNFDDYHINTVMCCRTEEEAALFMDYMNSVGKTLANGNEYSMSNLGVIASSYIDNDGGICFRFRKGTYGPYDYYELRGYNIIEFMSFDWLVGECCDGFDEDSFSKMLSEFGN